MESITQYTYTPLISVDTLKACMQAQASEWLAKNQGEAKALLSLHGDSPDEKPDGPIQVFAVIWENEGVYQFVWHIYQTTVSDGSLDGSNSVFLKVDPFKGLVLGVQ